MYVSSTILNDPLSTISPNAFVIDQIFVKYRWIAHQAAHFAILVSEASDSMSQYKYNWLRVMYVDLNETMGKTEWPISENSGDGVWIIKDDYFHIIINE